MIVLHSAFARTPHGHGGERRSTQIQRLLAHHGHECPQLEELAAPVPGKWLQKGLLASSLHGRFPEARGSLHTLRALGRDAFRFLPVFGSATPGVLVWESGWTQQFHIPLLAKHAGWKVVAVPHNLESLVPTQRSRRSGRASPHWLAEEMAVLARCDGVFTISREEQWLLQLHGIQADHLSYHPPADVIADLRAIRRQRASRGGAGAERHVLVLGSYSNPPTRAGLQALVREWPQLQGAHGAKCMLHVAGYGSEGVAADVPLPANVQLHGAVDQQTLERLLLETDSVLLHQEASSGALTRIPEMLMAGVPVIANAAAGRSWFRQEGVHIYEAWEDLKQLLQLPLAMPPEPAAPTAQEQRFVEAVRGLELSARAQAAHGPTYSHA